MNVNEILSIVLTGNTARFQTATEFLDVDMSNRLKSFRQLGAIDGLSNRRGLAIALNAIITVARVVSGTELAVQIVPDEFTDMAVVSLDLARFGLVEKGE